VPHTLHVGGENRPARRAQTQGRWRLAGRPHALLPGCFRWYVWTISKGANRRSTKPTVSAKLVIDEPRR
jgi:hypothetical protein